MVSFTLSASVGDTQDNHPTKTPDSGDKDSISSSETDGMISIAARPSHWHTVFSGQEKEELEDPTNAAAESEGSSSDESESSGEQLLHPSASPLRTLNFPGAATANNACNQSFVKDFLALCIRKKTHLVQRGQGILRAWNDLYDLALLETFPNHKIHRCRNPGHKFRSIFDEIVCHHQNLYEHNVDNRIGVTDLQKLVHDVHLQRQQAEATNELRSTERSVATDQTNERRRVNEAEETNLGLRTGVGDHGVRLPEDARNVPNAQPAASLLSTQPGSREWLQDFMLYLTNAHFSFVLFQVALVTQAILPGLRLKRESSTRLQQLQEVSRLLHSPILPKILGTKTPS